MCLGHGQLARDKGGRDRDKGGRDRVERAKAKAHEPHGRNRCPQPSRRRGAGCVGIRIPAETQPRRLRRNTAAGRRRQAGRHGDSWTRCTTRSMLRCSTRPMARVADGHGGQQPMSAMSRAMARAAGRHGRSMHVADSGPAVGRAASSLWCVTGSLWPRACTARPAQLPPIPAAPVQLHCATSTAAQATCGVSTLVHQRPMEYRNGP